jgi:hypothetical protein
VTADPIKMGRIDLGENADNIRDPGYPLVADAYLLWFFGGLPLLTVLAWRSRRPLSIPAQPINTGGQP